MSNNLEELIPVIISSPDLHARWLNTFSYMEYIGFRKIVKSQDTSGLSAETLAHAVEEGRHALKLKKLALKIGGSKFDRYEADTLLCQSEAEYYFQALDRHCESNLMSYEKNQKSRLTYLYVTWLVEIRALNVYKMYQAQLPKKTDFSLSSLLAEEEMHLFSVKAELRRSDPEFVNRAMDFKEFEIRLYEEYVGALNRELFRSEPLHESST